MATVLKAFNTAGLLLAEGSFTVNYLQRIPLNVGITKKAWLIHLGTFLLPLCGIANYKSDI
jgi:hypothetical protein